MNKKDNDILARDLVLAAFIVMKRQYESRDAGRAGKLQMFLNVHAGSHGDVKNIVARLNNPKSIVNLSEDQKRIYQRAVDIVESLSEPETGWVEPISLPEPDEEEDEGSILSGVSDEELARRVAIAKGEIPSSNVLGIPLSGIVEMTPEQAQKMDADQSTEQPKAKPGRKKNPIEAATTNAKKKGKACCN